MKNTMTTDELNDIARSAVNALHGERAPAHINADERDEWQAESDRLFLAACDVLAGVTDAQTARSLALSAVREAVGE